MNTLDKIFSNVTTLFGRPMILPPIGKSDHNVVIWKPSHETSTNKTRGSDIVVTMRSRDANSKAMLVKDLNEFNWSTLYRMEDTNEMVNFFNKSISDLMDYHLEL